MLTRVFLLIVYVVLSIPVTLLFIRSDGQGSYAPLAILFSWGILPEEYNLASGAVGGLVVPVCYLLGLLSLTTVCAPSSRPTVSFSPLVMHILGVAMALFAVTQNGSHGVDVTPGFLLESYATAALVAGPYLLGDWLLARKPKTGASLDGGLETLVGNSGGPGGPSSLDR
jgi:hypothetical protein